MSHPSLPPSSMESENPLRRIVVYISCGSLLSIPTDNTLHGVLHMEHVLQHGHCWSDRTVSTADLSTCEIRQRCSSPTADIQGSHTGLLVHKHRVHMSDTLCVRMQVDLR